MIMTRSFILLLRNPRRERMFDGGIDEKTTVTDDDGVLFQNWMGIATTMTKIPILVHQKKT